MRTCFWNGMVYTGELPLQEAFVVEDGLFLGAGSKEEMERLAMWEMKDAAEVRFVDLQGHFVCSGFNDSHMHLLSYGSMLSSVVLSAHTDSLNGMLEYLRAALEERHPGCGRGGWLLGRGWNQDYFTDVKRMPDRYDLDLVSREVPICINRCCGHCLVVNSKALELLGITGQALDPEGGRIGRCEGEADGRFYDAAMSLVLDRIPLPDKEQIKTELKAAIRSLNTYGITSCQSDDYCVYRKVPWQVIHEAYRELEAEGELTVRVYEQCNFASLPELQEFAALGNRTGVGTPLFRIGPLKMLGDGSLGARTAYLSEPYADDPTTRGIPVFDAKTFEEMIAYANRQNMSVAIHAIGDACLDDVLSAIEKALADYPREDHRHGIVHCQITRPDQLEKIVKLNLHVYAQTIFIDYDVHIVKDRVGETRADSSYRWKTLMNQGVSVSNGTDCPVELPDPMACMECAVTRTSITDGVGPYLPQEAFTVQEALDSYTIRSAEASFEELVKGRIQSGYYADFVILGENPFAIEKNRIHTIPVLETWLGGEVVYRK